MNEFSLIEKYFRPLTQNRPEALGLKDDAALLKIPRGMELVVTSDTLGAGTHFLSNEKPAFIAHKALRVNLSDLAAMGAKPYAYQLCISFPKKPAEEWAREFCGALLRDQKQFGIFCSGGDTTITKGPLNISITAFGLVPNNRAVTRAGAKPGHAIVITGSVGNALAGLRMLQNKFPKEKSCIAAYQKPTPRLAAAETIRAYAAAIDISDGLIADIGHIAKASNCAAKINLAQIQFSKPVQKLIDQKRLTREDALTGGDDYELALAVSQKNLKPLTARLIKQGLSPQIIGSFVKGEGVSLYNSLGVKLRIKKPGWTHF